MRVLAIDPGTDESGYVVLDAETFEIVEFNKIGNESLRSHILWVAMREYNVTRCVIEWVQSYGMRVGAEVFDTCRWVGIFQEHWYHLAQGNEGCGYVAELMYRTEVKARICGKASGVKDADIRAALIDVYGPGKDKAIGLKKTPGPLHGMKKDCWQALALAVAWAQQNRPGGPIPLTPGALRAKSWKE